MTVAAFLVIVGIVLVFLDLLVTHTIGKGTPKVQHVLLSVGVILIGIGVLAGNPVITNGK